MTNLRILSLFPLLLATPLFAQGEVDLRVSAKKGASVWLLVDTKLEQTIDMGGREMETAQNTSRVLNVTVKDVDDKGNLIVETKIARVHGNMTMPMGQGDFDFDSAGAKPAEDEDDGMGGMGTMMKKAMMAGAGKTFTAKVDTRGKVVELMDGAAELLKGNEGGMMSGNALDEGTLKHMVEGAFGVLPEKPVAVGAKWQHSQKEANGRMPMEQKLEMTLAKADDEAFEITATGTVEKPEAPAADKDKQPESDDPQATMAREVMRSMKVKNGKLTGAQRVSRKDGFVLDSTNTITMDVEMSAGPMGDMSMTMKTISATKRTTAEAAEAKKAEKPKEEPKKDAPKSADPAKTPAKEGK
jgi:hypothetical protein